ncbi:MAG: hypothetical protein M3495_09845 [Pseudomonadota bacterium]|nr:hypothetical protein [Gammaproteobacteria bacterium]MDQ3581882.1 hypothetical protein [Pseudomonadota bacterium]
MGFLTRIARGLAVHGYCTASSDPGRPQGFGPAMDSIEPVEPYVYGHFHHLHSFQSRFTNQASALAMSRLALGLIR